MLFHSNEEPDVSEEIAGDLGLKPPKNGELLLKELHEVDEGAYEREWLGLRPDWDTAQSTKSEADREQAIRERAYELWEAEGRPEDRAFYHWLAAEQELRRTKNSKQHE